MQKAVATFGAGCFWTVEAIFRQAEGVLNATSGFMGGDVSNPSYKEVYTDTTGHAEVVQVEYDADLISYEALLDIFWNNHNPTTLNQQGPDVGTRYRSVIFYHDATQQQLAAASLEKFRPIAEQRFPNRSIVTEIVAAQAFYAAEEYHQNYLEKNGLPLCHL